jgi:hypothetical protein
MRRRDAEAYADLARFDANHFPDIGDDTCEHLSPRSMMDARQARLQKQGERI